MNAMKKTIIYLVLLIIAAIPDSVVAQSLIPDYAWVKSAGAAGNSLDDQPRDIAVDINGNIYVTGTFSGSASFENKVLTGLKGSKDIFIAKYNTSGTLQWVKNAGMKGNADYVGAITADGLGNVYIIGVILSFTFGPDTAWFGSKYLPMGSFANKIYVAKYNSSGDAQWVKGLNINGSGNTNVPMYYGIDADNSNNIIITGSFKGKLVFGNDTVTSRGWNGSSGNDDIFVAKLDPNGNALWKFRSGSKLAESSTGVSVDNNGNSFITGTFADTITFGSSQLTGGGIFTAKINQNGIAQWARQGIGTKKTYGTAINADASGNVIVAGYMNEPVSFGSVSLKLRCKVSYIAQAFFIVKYDANGNVLWAKQGDACNNDAKCYGVATDASDNVYITGNVKGVIVIDTICSSSICSCDPFIAKFNPGGSILWLKTAGISGVMGDYGYAVAVDKSGDAIFAGILGNSNAEFGTIELNADPEGTDIFIAKINNLSVAPAESWIPVNKNLPADAVAKVLYNGGSSMFAGLGTSYRAVGGGVYKSSSDGTSWSEFNNGLPLNSQSDPNYPEVSALFKNGNFLYAGTANGGLYRSAISSPNWTLQKQFTSRTAIGGIDTLNSTLFAAVSGEGISKSVDGGMSWSEPSKLLPYNSKPWVILSTGKYLFSGFFGVYRSANNGLTWVSLNKNFAGTRVDTTYFWVFNLALSGNSIFVVDGSVPGGIYRSDNFGNTWVNASNGIPLDANNNYSLIYNIAASNGRLYASVETKGIYSSSDNGNTWNALQGKVLKCGNSLLVTSKDQYIIVRQGAELWRYETSKVITSGQKNNETFTAENTKYLKSYPNPFNSYTIIEYAVPVASEVHLSIYNQFGQLVRPILNKKQDAGRYSISFDASSLPPGIYYCHLITENLRSVQKMMIIK